MGKHKFIKVFFAGILTVGIFAYAYFFPTTMAYLDSAVNKVFAPEKPFEIFENFSEFSKITINKALYYIDIIKNNIEGNMPESKEIPTVLFTCLGKFPTKNIAVTSAFGIREHPIYKSEDFHTGLDIAAPKGADITASWPGTVFETGNDEIYGNYVIIEHSSGFKTKYCHLSKISVEENDFVLAGEKLGEAGNTGLTTGSHLHFEVSVDGKNIDPESCIEI